MLLFVGELLRPIAPERRRPLVAPRRMREPKIPATAADGAGHRFQAAIREHFQIAGLPQALRQAKPLHAVVILAAIKMLDEKRSELGADTGRKQREREHAHRHGQKHELEPEAPLGLLSADDVGHQPHHQKIAADAEEGGRIEDDMPRQKELSAPGGLPPNTEHEHRQQRGIEDAANLPEERRWGPQQSSLGKYEQVDGGDGAHCAAQQGQRGALLPLSVPIHLLNDQKRHETQEGQRRIHRRRPLRIAERGQRKNDRPRGGAEGERPQDAAAGRGKPGQHAYRPQKQVRRVQHHDDDRRHFVAAPNQRRQEGGPHAGSHDGRRGKRSPPIRRLTHEHDDGRDTVGERGNPVTGQAEPCQSHSCRSSGHRSRISVHLDEGAGTPGRQWAPALSPRPMA